MFGCCRYYLCGNRNDVPWYKRGCLGGTVFMLGSVLGLVFLIIFSVYIGSLVAIAISRPSFFNPELRVFPIWYHFFVVTKIGLPCALAYFFELLCWTIFYSPFIYLMFHHTELGTFLTWDRLTNNKTATGIVGAVGLAIILYGHQLFGAYLAFSLIDDQSECNLHNYELLMSYACWWNGIRFCMMACFFPYLLIGSIWFLSNYHLKAYTHYQRQLGNIPAPSSSQEKPEEVLVLAPRALQDPGPLDGQTNLE